MSVRSLRHLFEPERVLWIGPAGPVAGWARTAEANILDAGFKGDVRVLRSTGQAPEATRLESLAELGGGPCLAVACLPQADPARLLRELADHGCRAAVVLGGGAGPFNLDAQQRQALCATARRLDVRAVGPDRVGVIVPGLRLNAGAAAMLPPAGDLAFVTQSDSIATSMLGWAAARRIGFSRVVSLGESADIELGDILDYLALDLATRAILVHLEGVADARRFMSAARAAARVKPVVVIKSGRQLGRPPLPRGRSGGVRLHRDRVYDAAFARAGIVRVETIEELFQAAASLGGQSARRGHGLRSGRLALLTNGHAPAEFAADTLLAGGGALVRPTAGLHDEISRAVGPVASLASSVDLGLEAGPDAYAAALEVLLDTPDVDGVLAIHAPAVGVDPKEVAGVVAATVNRRKPRSAQRPVLAAWLGETGVEEARGPLDAAAIPVFTAPEPAVRAFLHRVHHERRQFLLRQTPPSRPDDLQGAHSAAEAVIEPALAADRASLNEAEAMAVLEAYGIAAAPTRLAADLEAAVAAAEGIGNPVALKIISPKLPQKSAAGGVALDIADKASLLRRGQEMLDRVAATAPGTKIEGLLVQRMERSLFPTELYLGMEVDPSFGPVLLAGHAALGAGDLAYLLPPLDSTLAGAMLDETAIGGFLRQQVEGAALFERVVETLVRLSQIVVDLPAVQRIAIDPLLATRDRLVVLDAHVDLARVPRDADATARLAVRPYPRELEQTATLRDGTSIRLRPIRPEDMPALKGLFDALTPEDRRMRLFSSMREIPDEFAARLTQIDYDREMVLVGLDPDDPSRFWGGARVAADADDRRAEYSVTVRSDKQGLGLGRTCLGRVLDYASKRGIEEVWGSVLAENQGMLGLADRLGFERHRDPDAADVVITTKRLRNAEGSSGPRER